MIPGKIDASLVDRLVTYALEQDGRFVVVENVPARVDEETGQRYFAPETADRLQRIIREGREPSRFIKTRVLDFTD